MGHDNLLGFGPILDGKMLNVIMTGMFNGDMVIDHIDSGHIVLIERSVTILWVSNFHEDGTQALSMIPPEKVG